MHTEIIELALKRLDNLERKLEKYFDILRINNELDFVLKGGYIFDEDISEILSGNYTMEVENE